MIGKLEQDLGFNKKYDSPRCGRLFCDSNKFFLLVLWLESNGLVGGLSFFTLLHACLFMPSRADKGLVKVRFAYLSALQATKCWPVRKYLHEMSIDEVLDAIKLRFTYARHTGRCPTSRELQLRLIYPRVKGQLSLTSAVSAMVGNDSSRPDWNGR